MNAVAWGGVRDEGGPEAEHHGAAGAGVGLLAGERVVTPGHTSPSKILESRAPPRGENVLVFSRREERARTFPTGMEGCPSSVFRRWSDGRGEISNRSASVSAAFRSP